MQKMLKRDQDEFSVHMHNDSSACGKLEVLEIIIYLSVPGLDEMSSRTDGSTPRQFMFFSKAIRFKTRYRDTWPGVEDHVLALRGGLGHLIREQLRRLEDWDWPY